MKERFVPAEPIKKGIQVTAISGRAIFEAIKPIVEPKIKRRVAKFLNTISGVK